MDDDAPKAALIRAAELAGGQAALGRKIGKAQSSVWNWLRAGRCPPEMAIPIEAAVERKVTRQQLRPDIYPAAAEGAPA